MKLYRIVRDFVASLVLMMREKDAMADKEKISPASAE